LRPADHVLILGLTIANPEATQMSDKSLEDWPETAFWEITPVKVPITEKGPATKLPPEYGHR
jgi:hypothetical protein